MNEQILKLAKQSGMRSPDLFKLTVSHMTTDTLEKFALLIVQECLLAISKTPIESDEIGTMVKCHNQVEQHFGVKE